MSSKRLQANVMENQYLSKAAFQLLAIANGLCFMCKDAKLHNLSHVRKNDGVPTIKASLL